MRRLYTIIRSRTMNDLRNVHKKKLPFISLKRKFTIINAHNFVFRMKSPIIIKWQWVVNNHLWFSCGNGHRWKIVVIYHQQQQKNGNKKTLFSFVFNKWLIDSGQYLWYIIIISKSFFVQFRLSFDLQHSTNYTCFHFCLRV